jgi:hypothetical protein
MKKLLLLLLLGGACLGGYSFMTGRLPWTVPSPEEQQVAALREEFGLVRQQWKQAGRAAAIGVDASSMTETPLAKLETVERTLEDLAPRLRTPEARLKANVLRKDISTFKNEMR